MLYFRAIFGNVNALMEAVPSLPNDANRLTTAESSLGTIAARLLSTHAEGESDAMVAMVGPGELHANREGESAVHYTLPATPCCRRTTTPC